MAQKKITDLQAISSVTDGLSVPSDNGTQSYRFTASQFMTYIYSKLNALSAVTPVSGDYIPILDASDSNNPKRATFDSFKNPVFRSVTSTDTAGADDEVLKLSGASFTQTLPALSGSGKRYRLLHQGTSLSQVYTVATTGGNTLGGYASGAYKLHVNGEMVEFTDMGGTDWIITNRIATTKPVSYTPAFVGCGTMGTITLEWFKRGAYMCIKGTAISGTPTGTEMRMDLPSGATSITTSVSLTNVGVIALAGSTHGGSVLMESNKTYLTFGASGHLVKDLGSAVMSAGLAGSMFIEVPIADWMP